MTLVYHVISNLFTIIFSATILLIVPVEANLSMVTAAHQIIEKSALNLLGEFITITASTTVKQSSAYSYLSGDFKMHKNYSIVFVLSSAKKVIQLFSV